MAGTVAGVGGVDEAPPRTGALLGFADQDQAVVPGGDGLVLVGASDVLFAVAPLKRTSGTAADLTRASSSDTRRSWLRLSAAGDGMGKPRLSRNFTTPPSYWSPGT